MLSEAAMRKSSTKYVFFENLQNSQENICVEVFFNKVKGLSPANLFKKTLRYRCLLKRHSDKGLDICNIVATTGDVLYKNRTSPLAAPVLQISRPFKEIHAV